MARREAAPLECEDRDVVVTCTLHWPFPVRGARWLGPIGDDLSDNRYRHFEAATVGEWRAVERAARQGAAGLDRVSPEQLAQIIKLADALHIADDVVLWPRLARLAAAGEVTVSRHIRAAFSPTPISLPPTHE
jgi:hypothetical protein